MTKKEKKVIENPFEPRKGFQASEIYVITKESEQYEYHGIGIHEERSKVKYRYFEGIEATLKILK